MNAGEADAGRHAAWGGGSSGGEGYQEGRRRAGGLPVDQTGMLIASETLQTDFRLHKDGDGDGDDGGDESGPSALAPRVVGYQLITDTYYDSMIL